MTHTTNRDNIVPLRPALTERQAERIERAAHSAARKRLRQTVDVIQERYTASAHIRRLEAGLDHYELVYLQVLARSIRGGRTGRVLAQATLCQRMKCSESTVRRTQRRLIAKGLIEVSFRYSKQRRGRVANHLEFTSYAAELARLQTAEEAIAQAAKRAPIGTRSTGQSGVVLPVRETGLLIDTNNPSRAEDSNHASAGGEA